MAKCSSHNYDWIEFAQAEILRKSKSKSIFMIDKV